MKKFLLTMALALLAGVTMAQNNLEFTFTRNGNGATVAVSGAEGVTATIAATSASNAWNTGGAMADRTDVLCPNTNTSATSESSPITYTLVIEGLNSTVTSVAFTHIAVNSGGNLQPSNDVDVRHCNFKLEANSEVAGTLSNQNIWIPSGATDKTIAFDDLEIAANGTLTIKLTLYKGTSNNGCFYGLTKITLTQPEEVVEQEVPFLTQVTASDLMAKTKATNIAIKNLSYTNNRWFVGNTGAAPYSAEDFTNDAIFVWEPVEAGVAGSYRLKKGDTYMQTSSPKDFGTVDNAAVFTAVAPGTNGTFNGDGDSNLYITGSTDANLVRFVKGNNWINIQNGAAGTPTYNTGTGGWTIHYVYEVAEVASFKANITAAGFATFFAPREVTIPEDVKAYYITAEGINGENVTLTEIENVIPANTAVILEGAEGEYTFNVSETGATAVSSNLLKGTIINTNIIGQAYVLGVVEGETGLYKTQMRTVQLSSASGSASVFQNNAYKAYLPASAVPASIQNAASFSFRFPGTTGVENVVVENEVKAIYDLTGRRVSEITEAGIYIIGGRKVLVK
ncbi:MAG: hypothetical protein IKY85_04410 [Bacteroidaceae bacterium]|nr:hypothetical protein [Bacteroidaceae bacterium]